LACESEAVMFTSDRNEYRLFQRQLGRGRKKKRLLFVEYFGKPRTKGHNQPQVEVGYFLEMEKGWIVSRGGNKGGSR